MAETANSAIQRVRPDQVLKHGILILATLVALTPTVFMLFTSVKSDEE